LAEQLATKNIMGFLASLKQTVLSARGKKQMTTGFHSQYDLGKQLGEGGFATVYSCDRRKSAEERLAVKVFDPKSANGVRKDFRLEVEIMKQIGTHPSCVQLLESFEEKRFCYLVMEKCSCTILDAFLGSGKQPATERELAQAFHSLLLAVDHLHSVRVVHRDIKPCNLLLKDGRTDGKVDVKLCDMGLAAIMPREGSRHCGCIPVSNMLTEVCGTAPYMSPEMLSEKPYSEVVDEWSCGVTMYVLMFGEFPYKPIKKNMELMKAAICSGMEKPSYAARPGLPQPSSLACELVSALMTKNVNLRVRAADALRYEFLEHLEVLRFLPELPATPSVSNEGQFVVPPVDQLNKSPSLASESHLCGQLPSFNPTLLHAKSTVLEFEDCTPAERKKTFEEALAALEKDHGKQWQRSGPRCSSEPSIRLFNKLQRLPARLSTHGGMSVSTVDSEHNVQRPSVSTVDSEQVDFLLPGTPSTTVDGESDSQSHLSL
jgi:serine/threonine protein kinase